MNTKTARYFICSTVFLLSVACSAQPSLSLDKLLQLPDSAIAFPIEAYLKIILDHHPVVKQTNLLSETARQEIRFAQGSFDPKLEFLVERKEFQDKTYYDLRDGYLYFPNRSPILPKVGYEQNSGERLNPSLSIPGEVQYFAGITLPIGRGLLTDERRTALKQAQIFSTIAEAEQIKLINKILLNAAVEYWAWYNSYYQYILVNQGAQVAREIFRRVKANYLLGEASPMDTVQAKITLQTRLVEQQESSLDVGNALISVSNYLWTEDETPVQLQPANAPVLSPSDIPLELQALNELHDLAKRNHPELIKLRSKIDQLKAERYLAREFLKPRLDLSYSLLSQPTAPRLISPTNDYKFGLDFSMPLLLRKERSKLALTEIKISSTTWEQTQTERDILNGISVTFNELSNTRVILGQQKEMVNLYEQLLQREFINLENGESDLFKINVQQEKLIQSQAKFVKLKSEYEKQKAKLYWAAGVKNLRVD